MNKTRLFLLSGLSLFALSTAANATLQEAEDAINDKDYVFALQELNRLIKVGDHTAEAYYNLAKLYENGLGVAKDEMQALTFYRRAAEAGDEKSALKVGNAYFLGRGVDRNYAEAYRWFKQSAEKGNYAAQYNIGLMLDEGKGLRKDSVKAFEFYQKAADQGYGPAQYALGGMFLKGIGTPQDFTAAIRWYKLAADQGDSQAQMDLAKLYGNTELRGLPFNLIGAHMYYNIVSAYAKSPLKEEAAALREEVTQKMQPQDVQMAQQKARVWHKKSRTESIPSKQDASDFEADLGGNQKTQTSQQKPEQENLKPTVKTDKETMLVAAGVGRRVLSDAVRNDDFKPVLDILTPKAEGGDVIAQLALGDLYMLGQGMKADPNEAFKWYSKAAESNSAIAFYKLGPIYCEGEIVVPDLARCYMYFLLSKKFADADSLPAVEETIKMLDDSFGQDIRAEGVKLAESYGGQAAAGDAKPKKGLLEGLKEKLMQKKEEEIENEVVQPKQDEQTSADDFFADM